MPNHYLMYVLPETVEREVRGDNPYLDHTASAQLGKVELGDVIWIVTITRRSGRLILVGRLLVGWRGGQADAARRFGISHREIWEADWHVATAEGQAEQYDPTDITGVAEKLRFQSSAGHDRLDLSKGVSALQLQAMRLLDSDSADLLNDLWHADPMDTSDDQTLGEALFEDLPSFPEGRIKRKLHRTRERNTQLVRAAKRHFLMKHGRLFCEICNFDFSEFYGSLGEDFIEAHHRQPFAELDDESVETRISDLAMVCANCHRMLHRRKPWRSVEELKAVLQKNNEQF